MNYYDNYDFISNFANDSSIYKEMTDYGSKYTGLIAAQWQEFANNMVMDKYGTYEQGSRFSEEKEYLFFY